MVEMAITGHFVSDGRFGCFFSKPQTNKRNMQMKMRIITSLVVAFMVIGVQAGSETTPLHYKLTVTTEIKRAFHSNDSIKITSVTGTAPKFQTGGTYRIKGTCFQRSLKNATFYLGNTAEAGAAAIVATAGSARILTLPSPCFAPGCYT